MTMQAMFGMPAAVIATLAVGMSSVCAGDAAETFSKAKAAETTRLYRVGRTGIFCFNEPCPWRGVVPAAPNGLPQGDVMPWAGDEPPALAAEPGERDRILAAWEDLECLLIEGRFADKTLEVSRIVGPC